MKPWTALAEAGESGAGIRNATHHLFPRISHAHYRAIARIIEDTAGEYGVPYNRTSLAGIIRAHFRFLRALGRRPA